MCSDSDLHATWTQETPDTAYLYAFGFKKMPHWTPFSQLLSSDHIVQNISSQQAARCAGTNNKKLAICFHNLSNEALWKKWSTFSKPKFSGSDLFMLLCGGLNWMLYKQTMSFWKLCKIKVFDHLYLLIWTLHLEGRHKISSKLCTIIEFSTGNITPGYTLSAHYIHVLLSVSDPAHLQQRVVAHWRRGSSSMVTPNWMRCLYLSIYLLTINT